MKYLGAIFDIDGVVVDSPHYEAWGSALKRLMAEEWQYMAQQVGYDPAQYNKSVYDAVVSGKPRSEGAHALLSFFNVEDTTGELTERLCSVKQAMIVELIQQGAFTAYPDSIRFIIQLKQARLKTAAASSSKNANAMLSKIPIAKYWVDNNIDEAITQSDALSLFDVNVCGWDFPKGKPAPDIFLTAATQLGLEPGLCFVVEDAPSGVQAAKAAGMACIGLARHNENDLLTSAGADWVIETLQDAFTLIQ